MNEKMRSIKIETAFANGAAYRNYCITFACSLHEKLTGRKKLVNDHLAKSFDISKILDIANSLK